MSNENIELTTETTETTEDQIVVETRVNKKTLQVAAIASAAGAAVAGVVCFMTRRNTDPVVEYTVVDTDEPVAPQD